MMAANFVDDVPGLKILLSQRHYIGKPLPSDWRDGRAIIDCSLRELQSLGLKISCLVTGGDGNSFVCGIESLNDE
jgi:hypothetical protein